MKKVFVMMILILAFISINGQTLYINNCSLTNNSNGGTYIPAGATAKIDFNYSAVDTMEPIQLIFVLLRTYIPDGSVHTKNMTTSVSSFSGENGASVDASLTFTMPTLTGSATDDTHMYVSIRIIDSGDYILQDPTDSNICNSNEATYIEQTLPVELSAFNAIATAEDFVNISWTVQSETNISGYFIIKGLQNDIETAQMIPAFINATNGAQEHSYSFTDKEVTTNNIYYYWLQSVEFSLQTELFGPTMVKVGEPTGGETVPVVFGNQLIGNYPNPFNPSTSISFSVANPEHVTINVFNVKGQLVKNLYDSFVSSNRINQRIDVLWNGKDNNNQEVASGVYYSKMNAGKFTDFKKMLLIK